MGSYFQTWKFFTQDLSYVCKNINDFIGCFDEVISSPSFYCHYVYCTLIVGTILRCSVRMPDR